MNADLIDVKVRMLLRKNTIRLVREPDTVCELLAKHFDPTNERRKAIELEIRRSKETNAP